MTIHIAIRAASIIALFVSFGAWGINPAVGQEFDPKDPDIIALGVNRAQVIVVGTFQVNWFYPWVDGWHYAGELHIKEILDGQPGVASIPFRWIERYGNRCLICEKLSRLNHGSGIWLLARNGGEWQLSGTLATYCGDPLPMDCRHAVARAIGQKQQHDAH